MVKFRRGTYKADPSIVKAQAKIIQKARKYDVNMTLAERIYFYLRDEFRPISRPAVTEDYKRRGYAETDIDHTIDWLVKNKCLTQSKGRTAYIMMGRMVPWLAKK